ncbi:eCIS core domain-containing protein [Mycobacterium sp.]|uniref:eCIS core domain-containing protein n=1 Tax=Mycobacterium sp. TaxID=1785 RepID=UPI002B901EA6|nr:DUF4157 domain-containing protein [Mycobacterium sp.]HTY32930.1 DUF4157 domain-containing protein [Mycobacterium sp.]
MGNLLGHDLSTVKIHSGEATAASARALGARAYTVGDDIFLGNDVPSLTSRSGRYTLGHELVHVVQQRLGGTAPLDDLYSPHEHEAEVAAAALVDGRMPPRVVRGTAVGVARQPENGPTDGDNVKRARQIDDYVRAHPDLGLQALQALLIERNALLPLAQVPPTQLAKPVVRQGNTSSGAAPTSPLQVPGAIQLAAGVLIVPAKNAASTLSPALLTGAGASATTTATAGTATLPVAADITLAGDLATAATMADIDAAVLATAAPLVAENALIPIVGWIFAGVIVVGVVGYLVYRYSSAPSPGSPEPASAPGGASTPAKAPGTGSAPALAPGTDTHPAQAPGSAPPGPITAPGAADRPKETLLADSKDRARAARILSANKVEPTKEKIDQYLSLLELYNDRLSRMDDSLFETFEGHAIIDVNIGFLRGSRAADFAAADELAERQYGKPKGYAVRLRETKGLTWHHHPEMGRMILMYTKAHAALSHWGGVSVVKYMTREENYDE